MRSLTSSISKSSSSSSSSCQRPRGPIRSGVLGTAAFLDGDQRQVKIAIGIAGRGGKHGRCRGIRPFQRLEGEFRRGIGMLQRVDQLFGRVVVGQPLTAGPLPQQPCNAGLRGVVARRLG